MTTTSGGQGCSARGAAGPRRITSARIAAAAALFVLLSLTTRISGLAQLSPTTATQDALAKAVAPSKLMFPGKEEPALPAERASIRPASLQLDLPNPHTQSMTSLSVLIPEAESNNSQILAARDAARAATQISTQVSTRPDPQFVLQQSNVGSPRPFAGFTNSEFAYIGLGVSQDLPYPGKLRLRGEIAERGAASAIDRVETVRRQVIEELEEAYFQLAYFQQTLAILERDGKLLDQVEKIAEARYRVGQGTQQDVLKAQLERTKLLGEVAMHYRQVDSVQAEIRQLLSRAPDSPDITAEDLTESSVPFTLHQLLESVRTGNPDVNSEQEAVQQQGLQVELAHKDFYPDFNLQYMWQHTAEQFRDYHVLSFGIRIPIYRDRKQRPEMAQAVDELNQSRRQYEARVQRAYFEVRDQLAAADTSAHLLQIYRDGLLPQATATFQAGLVAYESNREDLETLLGSFLDLLKFDEEYWQTLAAHETSVARLEQLTGLAIK